MDIDAEFLPLAEELIDDVFATPIQYRRLTGATYDPALGQMSTMVAEVAINAGVLRRSRGEEGGSEETWTLALWIHHGPTGLPFLPTTGDEVLYDGSTWKVTVVDPTYSSKGLIASKLLCRSPG